MFDTREKKERALGVKLFLKAERCGSAKCATVRRPYRPGAHGKKRRPLSEVGRQLSEKQKIRFSYGIREAQLRRLFSRAAASSNITSQMIIALLERRLDNIVYRLGLAPSRSVARQLVGHGHFMVNNRKVTIPSYEVGLGDVVSIRPQSRNHPAFGDLEIRLKKYEPPQWLELNKNEKEGKMTAVPQGEDASLNVDLVVDYYAKRV